MKQTTNMARVIGEIQRIARAVNVKWFDNELNIEDCIWTVQSQPTSYGFFTPYNSYRVNDKIEGLKDAVEISLGAGTLDRPIEELIGTIIHEMTHWYNFIHEVKDVSRGNTYHNKHFRTEAEKHGIRIDYDSRIGWSLTSPTEELIDWIIEEGFEDIRLGRNEYSTLVGITGTGRSGNGTVVVKPPKKTSIKLVCPCCGQIVRTTNPNHSIGCWECQERMIEA